MSEWGEPIASPNETVDVIIEGLVFVTMAFSTLLVCVFVLLHISQAAHVLTATPSVIGVGLTRSFEVKCTFKRESNSVISSLLSLHIAHSKTVDNPVFSLLASINAHDNKVTGAILNTAAMVSGSVNNNGESFIKITWSYPQKQLGGRFRCRANGVNNIGKVVDSVQGTIVKAEMPTLDSVVQELVNLTRYVDALEAKVADTSAYQNNKMNVSASLATQFIISDEYKGRRYYLNSRTHYFTANDAHFRCHMYGGYLAEIDDVDEFNFVRSFLMTKNPRFFEMLLGGSDEANEGQWVFPYRNNAPVKYFNWSPGQPNAGRGENNLCYWRDSNYYMSDCTPLMTYDWSYVCEIPLIYTK